MKTRTAVALVGAASVVLSGITCQVGAGQEAFRETVLSILAERWPDEDFVASDEPMVIVWGDYRLGLANLEARLASTDPRSDSFKQAVIEHFQTMLEHVKSQDADLEEISWERASEIVRIQWVPTTYDMALQTPFSEHVSIGAVLDLGMSVSYVRPEDLERWQVKEDALFKRAIQNLEMLSLDIELHTQPAGGEGVGYFLAVTEGDSYDAARLLLPGFRKRIADKLGEPFLAAVPNRDFLVCWSTEYSHGAAFAKKVEEDFNTQPYPLSPKVYLAFVDRVEPTAITQ
jgi:uncharacterized protein YtpQ (UPF0354 family)